MSKTIRTINTNEDLKDKFDEMLAIVMGNIERGNIRCYKAREEDGELVPDLHVVEGRRIDYHVGWKEPLYGKESGIDKNFITAFEDLREMHTVEERAKCIVPKYCVIGDGENYCLYIDRNTDYGVSLEPVMEMGDYDYYKYLAEDERFADKKYSEKRTMEPGEFEFKTTEVMRLGTDWLENGGEFKGLYEIVMSPEDLVKKFAGTGYAEGFRYKCVEEISGNPGSLRRDPYYDSFKTIEEIATEIRIRL